MALIQELRPPTNALKHVSLNIGAALLLCAAPANAMIATVNVTHNDPDGIINPGQLVHVTVRLNWTFGYQFAGMRGDTILTNDSGHATNLHSVYSRTFGPIAFWGTPRGGSIIGTDIAVVGSFFTASPHPESIKWSGMTYIDFDWTAPSPNNPTIANVDFVSDPVAPNARFYPSGLSPAWVEAEMTYFGTTLTVLPAPAGSTALLLAAGAMATRRRRFGRLRRE